MIQITLKNSRNQVKTKEKTPCLSYEVGDMVLSRACFPRDVKNERFLRFGIQQERAQLTGQDLK